MSYIKDVRIIVSSK